MSEYYKNDKFKFEEEDLNLKKWNDKRYNIKDNTEFEIKNKNGEEKEKEKEYYKNGKLKFEGEYLNRKRNGKGKEYYYYNGT